MNTPVMRVCRSAAAPSGRWFPRKSTAAFTLLELLLALALLTLLVTALLTFVFSMGEIWGRGGEKRLFEQHVNAVTRHVESLLLRAAWPHGGTAATEPFAVREVRAASAPSAVLLGFDLLEGDRLLEWPGEPLPEVRCQLAVEPGRGLVIYWQSLLEADAGEKAPRTALVSPLVISLTYAYRDPRTGSWRIERSLRRSATNEWLLPNRLVLAFREDAFEATREITLPLGGIPPLL